MLRQIALTLVIGSCTLLPLTGTAAADDAASVLDVSMLVNARVNGKDTWSPGGKELQWAALKCPLKIQFKGQVTVGKPTAITYRWDRSDGTQSAVLTFDVKAASAPAEVIPPDVWNVGKSGQTFRGAETFHVLTPSDLSTTTPVKVDCQ